MQLKIKIFLSIINLFTFIFTFKKIYSLKKIYYFIKLKKKIIVTIIINNFND